MFARATGVSVPNESSHARPSGWCSGVRAVQGPELAPGPRFGAICPLAIASCSYRIPRTMSKKILLIDLDDTRRETRVQLLESARIS